MVKSVTHFRFRDVSQNLFEQKDAKDAKRSGIPHAFPSRLRFVFLAAFASFCSNSLVFNDFACR